MDNISSFYHIDDRKIRSLLRQVFKDQAWLKVFLDDRHHGFTHGSQVREACLKLITNLNPQEKKRLILEGGKISKINSYRYAVTAIEIAALFHDCGRFNQYGEVVAGEQKRHQILSAQRAEFFCYQVGLSIIIPDVHEAILCHDFQSKEFTPYLNPPRTIIGKIVQSSDQMGWFHPESLTRTLYFNQALGVPFYEPRVSFQKRLHWKPGIKAQDALTVMLSQLFGPISDKRFGIEFARNKVRKYKCDLERNIVKIAKEYKLQNEVEALIKDFKKYSTHK